MQWHDHWFCQIELIEPIWQRNAELRVRSIFIMDEPFIRLLRQTTMNCFSCAINVGWSLPFMAKYESFCNVQSWQHWHFVQLPMEIFTSRINFNAHLHWLFLLWINIEVIDNLFSKLCNTKMPIIANFVYYGEKLEAFLRNKIHVFSKKFIRLYFPYLYMAFKNILIINKSEIFIRYGQLFLVFSNES